MNKFLATLNPEERIFRSDFPGVDQMMNYAKQHDFENLYKNLIKNLDPESITTVNRILARFYSLSQNKKIKFTMEELEQLDSLDRTFYQERIKLNSNCYAWKNFFLPIRHFEASVFYYQNGITNLTNLQRVYSQNIIDVGGFIGDSALIFSKYTNKNIYSFEPSSKNFALMQKTIQLNSKKKIIPINLGLGGRKCQAKISLEVSSALKTNQHLTSRQQEGKKNEIVNITTLDDFVKENKLTIGLIKVDIEGNEQDFLQGAKKTIQTQKPALLISIYHHPSDFFQIKPLIESWNLGYKIKIVKCIDGDLCAETLLIAELKEGNLYG